MTAYNRNAVWCDAIVDELVRGGVRDVVLCPGGRSGALALRIDGDEALRTLVHTDERSGAFIALGIARTTGAPVAVCTTSGSAVANALPAILEADADGLPLVLLSCDRPRGVRDAGAPQTTEQLAICAAFVRGAADLDDPSDDVAAAREATARVLATAVARGSSGPVQLNIPLHGVYDSTEPDEGWTAAPAAFAPAAPRASASAGAGAEDARRAVATLGVRPGARGLIVAGPGVPLAWGDVDALARATGYPVIADAYTGLRTPAVANVVSEADVLVLDPVIAGLEADVVIRLGAAPLVQTLHAFLGRQRCPVIRLDAQRVERDFLSASFELLHAPTSEAAAALGEALGPGDDAWRQQWLEASRRARAGLDGALVTMPWCESVAASIACRAEAFDFLHVANSMPVRHANVHVAPSTRSLAVYANRGVNGIDGTLGTFLGELRGGGRGLLLVGDQSTLHDLPALAAAGDGARGCICVLANGGGALFDLLPVSRFAGYRRAIRNPPDLDLASIASAFGLGHACVESADALRDALAVDDGVSLVEAAVASDAFADELGTLYRAMLGA